MASMAVVCTTVDMVEEDSAVAEEDTLAGTEDTAATINQDPQQPKRGNGRDKIIETSWNIYETRYSSREEKERRSKEKQRNKNTLNSLACSEVEKRTGVCLSLLPRGKDSLLQNESF